MATELEAASVEKTTEKLGDRGWEVDKHGKAGGRSMVVPIRTLE